MRSLLRVAALVIWQFAVRITTLTLVSSPSALAQQDLTEVSIEELMNIRVTSVSRKEQHLLRTGAAVYVITRDDIRRSGMTSIPELLRMVPGANVARITANTWAVSIRGFNNRYSTRVLVLIDGRTVYTPEFGGVFWDQQTVPLEEIERIEVIRGPGGTVWGANAANGVINIITRKAQDTRGAAVSMGTGSQDSAAGYARYGGAIRNAAYRVYGRYFNIEGSRLGDDRSAPDGWNGLQGGFRMDWTMSNADDLTIQADMFRAGEGQRLSTVINQDGFRPAVFNELIRAKTTNLQGQWTHSFGSGAESSLQFFYADAHRIDQAADDQDTVDLDFQYRFRAGDRHDFVAGVGYRRVMLDYEGYYNYRYTAPELHSQLFSVFIQDEIRLATQWSLTVGSKLEHNSFTQVEFEPSAQLVWSPSEHEALWFSAARAIRQPSWFYANSVMDAAVFPLDNGDKGVFRLLGSTNSQAEQVFDFEAGYRRKLESRLSVDLSMFRSYYRQLATAEAGTPYFEATPERVVVFPSVWANRASAGSYGVEAFLTWQATARWRLTPGYSFLRMNVRRDRLSNDTTVEASVGNSPKHQAQLRSRYDLTSKLEWDTALYYVGALRTNVGAVLGQPVDSYVRLDTRLGWHVGEFTELSIAGQNLLAPRRFEFTNSQQVVAAPVQRAIVAKVTWQF